MPRLADPAFQSLIVSLNEYHEQHMRDAIESARDPEVAEQLVEWLQKTFADEEDTEWMDRISTISVATVLGEAKASGIVSVLLNRVTTASPLQLIDELFEYVLRRMGEPMIREAIARISNATKPWARTELYSLMDSAHTLSPALQREIADFCFARMPIEMELPADRNGKTSWFSCCRLLITLADARVGHLIERGRKDITRRKRRDSWDRLATSFQRYFGEPMQVREDCDHRMDWTQQVPKWEQAFRAVKMEFGDPELDEMLRVVNSLGEASAAQPIVVASAQDRHPVESHISRNGPCPCGSGRKYKKCCGTQ